MLCTKRHELLAYGARGDRAAAATAAEMAAAVNAGRVHNRLTGGFAGQPHDALQVRHVKGALALMLAPGARHPAAEATVYLHFPDGEPRYAILGASRRARPLRRLTRRLHLLPASAFLPPTSATTEGPPFHLPLLAAAPRSPLRSLQQQPQLPPAAGALKTPALEPLTLEALHDAIRAGEECTGELLRLDEVSVRNEAQLARLCALLASARSSLAYVAQEERELVERLGEAEAETRAATAHFGSQVNESIYLDMLLEMGTGVEEHRESAADLGARSLHLLEQFSALQGRVNQQHATVGRLMDAADSVMNRASDMHAACSAAAAELEAAIEVAQIQAQILEGARARSPDQIAERLIDAALRRLHAALMGAR